METIPLTNINTFYKFTCDDSFTDRILETVKQEIKWEKNSSNQISEDDLFFHQELFDWFEECILSVKEKIGIPNTIDLPITSCWANKANKMQGHHTHKHPNCVLAGVFYLTSHNSGETLFEIPNHWLASISNFSFGNKSSLHNYGFKMLPKKSTLVIFPAYLGHSVLGLRENETRYTLSFNTYISGEIDGGENRTRLHLNPKSVRDWHNKT
jgi:uncharacterized protein (TIGR02466 family)